MNFVRLGAFWEAAEPGPNFSVFDTDYLDKLVQLVDKLGEAGIHVLIDNH